MKSIKNLSLLLLSIFLFNGCLLNNPSLNKAKYLFSTQITDLSTATQNLVMDMKKEIHNIIPIINNHVYVTDFVNLRNSEVTSELGLVLASEVKTHISRNFHIPIKELRYSKYMQIGKNGTNVLTRDLSYLNTKEIKKTFVFVGSYTMTQKQLILHLKLINMKNGNILAMTSSHVELTEELKSLGKSMKKPIIRPHVVL